MSVENACLSDANVTGNVEYNVRGQPVLVNLWSTLAWVPVNLSLTPARELLSRSKGETDHGCRTCDLI
ncbi:MAG: hypothetical protein VYD76_06115 [Pseudomonadota bacterium]|nr:hypothetical protein [Pseudomonadota bacterium]